MFDLIEIEKNFFIEKGYLKKKIFINNKSYMQIAFDFKNELDSALKNQKLTELGGYKSGNLNIDTGLFEKKFIEILLNSNFSNFFNYITNDNLENYEIRVGGNLNFYGSKTQLFHMDGGWDPRMLIVSIATSEITTENGPIELLEKSHKSKVSYWRFLSKFFSYKKKKITLEIGEVLIREHRLWHRGTKNNSARAREMIGIMLLKKDKRRPDNRNFSKNVSLFSNMFETTFKGKVKEFVFLNLKIFLVLYKIILSIKSK